jgi:hypothetical protein
MKREQKFKTRKMGLGTVYLDTELYGLIRRYMKLQDSSVSVLFMQWMDAFYEEHKEDLDKMIEFEKQMKAK